VDACDFSTVARQKALERAKKNKVKINYFVADVAEVLFEPNTYDVIALIYLHLSPAHRNLVHQKLVAGLKPGGVLLLETFSKDQLKYGTGGPKNPDLLYELTEIETDFRQLNIKQLEQTEVVLNEGDFHRGLANVIRLIGIKPLAGTSHHNATGGYLAPDADIKG
jgi:SAM-dependent methyltransferase